MNPTGNTILITGGGSGIGRGLAESLHALGNQVIIAGRRRQALDETTAANPGMKSLTVDIAGPRLASAPSPRRLLAEFPSLNVLINNAGIMRAEKLARAAARPGRRRGHRRHQPARPHPPHRGACCRISKSSRTPPSSTSPRGWPSCPWRARPPTAPPRPPSTPTRFRSARSSAHTSIEVLELIPPYVATHLMGGADDPRAMPLAKFIAEVMEILKTQPTPPEICVENVKTLRFAAENPAISIPSLRGSTRLRLILADLSAVTDEFAPKR